MIFFIDNAKNEVRNTFPAMLDQDEFMAAAYTGDRRGANMTFPFNTGMSCILTYKQRDIVTM